MFIDLDTFVISDTHWGHGNIVKYANRPELHNEIMIAQHLRLVGPDDTILHLGDLCMTGSAQRDWYDAIRRLPGKRYLLRGNHDKENKAFYEDLGYHVLPYDRPSKKRNNMQGGYFTLPLDDGRQVAFSHVPLWSQTGWSINVHGHIHTNGYPTFFEGAHERRDFRNVSVEVIGYRPVRLREVIYGTAYQSVAQAGLNNHDERLSDQVE